MTDDRELIMQTYFQTSNEIAYWNRLANDHMHEISKQLLGAAVITIPLVGTIVAGRHVSVVLGVILAFGLFFILVSIAAGIRDLQIASDFFNNYTIYNSNRAKALYDAHNKKLDEALEEARKANSSYILETKSNNTYSTIQGYCIGIGLLLVSGVTIALVFMSH